MYMSCEHTTFSLMFVKLPKKKRMRSQTKKVVVKCKTILMNSAGVNGLKISETMPVS